MNKRTKLLKAISASIIAYGIGRKDRTPVFQSKLGYWYSVSPKGYSIPYWGNVNIVSRSAAPTVSATSCSDFGGM
jgi:hypothetical protein